MILSAYIDNMTITIHNSCHYLICFMQEPTLDVADDIDLMTEVAIDRLN